MAKYTYSLECPYSEKWNKFTTYASRDFCYGYLSAMRGQAPRLNIRMVRSDGKIMDEIEAYDDVNIGQIAGWPTAEQYERAGNEALQRARIIREKNKKARMATVCETCDGGGVVGSHCGQTPESYDITLEPCPDCNPNGTVL